MATKSRGFASMDQSKQRQIASKGGKAAHKQGKAHEWNSNEAKEAGRKGGQQRRKNSMANKKTANEAKQRNGSTSQSQMNKNTWDDFSSDVDDLTEL